ncbi:ABC transporter permease [Candidatus Sumerlaeota bacterium]|nr:ABC transporter permease [Candidatus Sumerlaeota bacterium]
MRVERLISRRHLVSRERLLRIRLTALIGIIAIAIGVGALIAVVAILDGFDASFHQKHMDLVAHVRVLPPDGADDAIFADPATIAEALAEDPRVVAFAPLVDRECFLLPDRDLGARRMGVRLLGVDPEEVRPVASFVDETRYGHGEPGPDEIVLGQLLATQVLGVRPGDTVWAITRLVVDAHGFPHVRWQPLRVVGLFVTGIPDLDMATAYVNRETAERIFLLPEGAVSAFQLRIADPYRAATDARAIAAAHPELPVRLQTWDETNPEFFQALQLEKVGTFVMVLMIVLVGAFNIIGTLVMIVTERTREIGILKTMGASDRLIRRIFFRSGLVIGLIGAGLGLALGLGLCAVLGRLEAPLDMYEIERLPVLIHWGMVALIMGVSLAICVVAALVPAMTASRLDPVEALRHE